MVEKQFQTQYVMNVSRKVAIAVEYLIVILILDC